MQTQTTKCKAALIHDWIVAIGGAEKVLEAIHALYPAPIHTLFAKEPTFKGERVETTWLQRVPFLFSTYRYLLPLFPKSIESFDLSAYDLLLSSSHAVAKGVKKLPHQLHICYCHTPMRYAWDLSEQYLQNFGGFRKKIAAHFLSKLRAWDLAQTSGVDHFIANSHFVAERIARIYGRPSTVIYPPVATDSFYAANRREEFYLTVSRLVPYKKIDLIVDAFAEMPERTLIVIGDGPEMGKIKKRAAKNRPLSKFALPEKIGDFFSDFQSQHAGSYRVDEAAQIGPVGRGDKNQGKKNEFGGQMEFRKRSNIEILGEQSDAVVRDYLSRCRAFVFAAEEDFGIAPVEAQASGAPVIAFGRGGVTETVIENETGLFFEAQTIASLKEAVLRFEKIESCFDPKKIKKHAEQFNRARFDSEFKTFVEQKLNEHHHSRRR